MNKEHGYTYVDEDGRRKMVIDMSRPDWANVILGMAGCADMLFQFWENWVYFVQDRESMAVKIGTTTDVPGRIKEIQSCNPNKVALVGYMPGDHKRERAIHHMFKEYRIRGEWFRASRPLCEFVRKYADPQQNPAIIYEKGPWSWSA